MKLLLDQNLSHRIVKLLDEAYPGSAQVGFEGLGDASDDTIWRYAEERSYAIVTLDADFHEYSVLRGGPPLIVWLKCGNQPKQVVLDKLLRNREEIERADLDPEIWCVEIY